MGSDRKTMKLNHRLHFIGNLPRGFPKSEA